MGIKSIISTVIIMVIALLIFSYITDPTTRSQVKQFFSEAKSNIKSNVNKISTEECPQINVSMRQTSEYYPPGIVNLSYGEWKISTMGPSSHVLCEKGNEEGENMNHFYCGKTPSGGLGIGVIEKQRLGADGTIGKTIKMIFYNEYDENMVFIRTVCGEDPDVIEERRAKALMGAWE